MKTTDVHKQHLIRREVLGYLAASGVAAALWPAFIGQAAEIWEEGDSICAPQQYPALEKPNGYELDSAYLESFLTLRPEKTTREHLIFMQANDEVAVVARLLLTFDHDNRSHGSGEAHIFILEIKE